LVVQDLFQLIAFIVALGRDFSVLRFVLVASRQQLLRDYLLLFHFSFVLRDLLSTGLQLRLLGGVLFFQVDVLLFFVLEDVSLVINFSLEGFDNVDIRFMSALELRLGHLEFLLFSLELSLETKEFLLHVEVLALRSQQLRNLLFDVQDEKFLLLRKNRFNYSFHGFRSCCSLSFRNRTLGRCSLFYFAIFDLSLGFLGLRLIRLTLNISFCLGFIGFVDNLSWRLLWLLVLIVKKWFHFNFFFFFLARHFKMINLMHKTFKYIG